MNARNWSRFFRAFNRPYPLFFNNKAEDSHREKYDSQNDSRDKKHLFSAAFRPVDIIAAAEQTGQAGTAALEENGNH